MKRLFTANPLISKTLISKRLISLTFITIALIDEAIFPSPPASAASDCAQKVCVEVYTDPSTNQVVIKARKGSGPVAPKPSATSAPAKPPTHKPLAPRKPRPYVYRPYTPRPKKSSVPKKAATSLADQLTQLIPVHNFFYQPSPAAIVGIPVYLWSDTDPNFATVVNLLGEAISVNLRPTFTFNFGDGSPEVNSDSPGAAYPSGTITHIYSRAGQYPATLRISWGGQWSVAGEVSPVLGGAIIQNYQQVIRVAPAPTKYLH